MEESLEKFLNYVTWDSSIHDPKKEPGNRSIFLTIINEEMGEKLMKELSKEEFKDGSDAYNTIEIRMRNVRKTKPKSIRNFLDILQTCYDKFVEAPQK